MNIISLSELITKEEFNLFLDQWEESLRNKEPLSMNKVFLKFVESNEPLKQRCIEKNILPAYLGYMIEYIMGSAQKSSSTRKHT